MSEKEILTATAIDTKQEAEIYLGYPCRTRTDAAVDAAAALVMALAVPA